LRNISTNAIVRSVIVSYIITYDGILDLPKNGPASIIIDGRFCPFLAIHPETPMEFRINTIVGHITLSIVSSGIDSVANGELIINRGPQAGSYLVFLNMQPPMQSNLN
jgi:hypothetical protein